MGSPRASALDCGRCDAVVDPIRVWHGWNWCWRAWLCGLVVVVAMAPLLAYDFCVLIPGMMIYIAAGGPLRTLARTAPVCRRCSLELVEGVTTGKPLRPKRT